jgi:hypothetical protein
MWALLAAAPIGGQKLGDLGCECSYFIMRGARMDSALKIYFRMLNI